MPPVIKFAAGVFCVTVASLGSAAPAKAQLLQLLMAEIALKSGETVEIGNVGWSINCRSFLKSTPVVTILDGPPEVTAQIKEAQIIPRVGQCAKSIPGGKLFVTAGEVTEQSYTTMVLRVRYNTRDGVRDRSQSIAISLLP